MAETEFGGSGAGPLVRLHIVPSRLLWRIGPAWAVLAGALVAGAPLLAADALFRLTAAAVLADLLWGALRQSGPAPQSGQAAAQSAPAALPYARPDAPLAAFLTGLSGHQADPLRAPWQGLLLSLALIGGLSVLLGPAAMLLSVAALLVWGGWRVLGGAAFGDAVLDVALPWLLGASLAGRAAFAWPVWALAGAFTLLQWGALRAQGGRAALGWLGQGAVLAVLIALRQPWALASVAMLLAPATWWLAARRPGALAYALPWWWGAMMIAALTTR